MAIESRTSLRSPVPVKHADLPDDYLKMVSQVFEKNFEKALGKLGQIKADPSFQAYGAIYPTEVVLVVSIIHPEQISANTFYASMDYDPKASTPKVEDLLSICLDALAALCDPILNTQDPDQFAALAEDSMSALENVPFEWTEVPFEKKRVFLKMDKSNPALDAQTDDWLAKNDPETRQAQADEERKTEDLFVTGKKKTIH